MTRTHLSQDPTPGPAMEMTHRQVPAEPAGITLTEYTAAAVHELLAIADEFLRTASPTVHAELRAYLNHQVPPADPTWFIDMLGFNAMHLARQLTASASTLREAWTSHPGAEIHDDKWGQKP